MTNEKGQKNKRRSTKYYTENYRELTSVGHLDAHSCHKPFGSKVFIGLCPTLPYLSSESLLFDRQIFGIVVVGYIDNYYCSILLASIKLKTKMPNRQNSSKIQSKIVEKEEKSVDTPQYIYA